MLHESGEGEHAVLTRFLEAYLADRESGVARTLDDYLLQFPGHASVIAREFLSLEEGDAIAREHGTAIRGTSAPAGIASGGAAGDLIGHYQVLHEIGRGGQGIVYLAEDTQLHRKVALKVLKGMGSLSEDAVARFRREAEAASRLDHPGICAVYEAGLDGNLPYIAMRLVEGESLAAKIASAKSEGEASANTSFVHLPDVEAPLSSPSRQSTDPSPTPSGPTTRAEIMRVVQLIEKVARALHAAHEAGVLHRDMKPGNVMVPPDGEAVIMDFGLAYLEDEQSPTLTQTGDFMGTPAYMSPEQLLADRVRLDRRTDVWSLGVMLYECVTLMRPFDAPTREGVYQAIMTQEAPDLRRLNPALPADLRVVVATAIAKDRDRRYQTALDLAEELRRVREGEPILAKRVSMLGRAWRWSKRRPAWAALVCALALGIPAISGLGVWYWTHRDDVKAQERARQEALLEDALEAGFYEVHEGSLHQAVVAFEKALSIEPGSAEAVVGLALAHAGQNLRRNLDLPKEKHELGSSQALEAALRVIIDGERSVADPKVLARTKADILTKLGRMAEAAVALESAPKIEGTLMWFLEGTRAIDAGDSMGEDNPTAQPSFQEAAGHLTRAVSGSTRARRAYHFQLAHAIGHCKPAERNSALAMADALEELWPTSPTAWRWIAFLSRDVDPGRMVAAYREAIRLRPGYAGFHVMLGRDLNQKGRLEEAIAELREAIRLDPEIAPAHASLGSTLALQGKQEEAIAEYREAIRLDSEVASTHRDLGVSLARAGKQEEAIAEYREAIRLDAGSATAHFNLGVSLARAGKQEEAIAEYREAIRLDAGSATAHFNLGVSLARAGKQEEAIAEYREAIRLDAGSATAHFNLGHSFASLGKLEEAIAEYREAIRLDPGHAAAHEGLGLVLDHQGEHDEAIAELRAAIQLAPGDAGMRYTLGALLGNQRKLEEAIKELRAAIRLDSTSARAHAVLGNALAKQGKLEEAIEELREAIRLDPTLDGAHFNLGSFLRKQGKLEEALAAFRAAIRLEAGCAEAHSNVGWILAKQRNLEEAIAAYRKAILLDPRLGNARFNLALALAKQGKLDEAIKELRELTRLEPDDAGAHERLAALLHRHGDLAQAVAVQEKVLRLMNGTDVEDLKLVEMQDALDVYRDALALAAESKPSQPESRK